MLNRSKLLAVSLLAVMFVAGVAVGGAASAVWGGGHDRDRTERRDRGPRRSYTQMLTDKLGLSPVQQDSVRAILERREQAMRDIWKDTEPRFDSLRHQIRQEILAQLDAEQQDKYDALIAKSDSARTERERRERERREPNRGNHERKK
jgi:hypothetical protein